MELIFSKNQLPVPVINGFPLHSKINPIRESKSFSKDIKNDEFPVVLGLGFAYHLQNFDSNLVVIEPDKELIQEYKKQFPESTIEPLSGDTEEILYSLNHKFRGFQVRDIKIKVHQPSLRARPDLYQPLFFALQQWQEKSLLNLISDSAFGALWTKNALKNFKEEPRAPKISNFSASPVFILGSGFSLSQHIDTIKKNQHKAIIIAIPPVLEILKIHKIQPDMVLLVDGGHANRFYLQELDAPLLAYLNSSSLYIRNWKNKQVMFFHSGLAIDNLIVPEHPILPISGSAANTALELGAMISKEVWICGFDFSFMESYYHYPGNPLEKELLFQSDFMAPLEQKLLKLMLRGESSLIQSRTGRKLKTNLSMASYYQDFCEKLKKSQGVRFYTFPGEGPVFPNTSAGDINKIEHYPQKKIKIQALNLVTKDEKLSKLKHLLTLYLKVLDGENHPITDMHLSRFYLKRISAKQEIEDTILKIKTVIKQLEHGA